MSSQPSQPAQQNARFNSEQYATILAFLEDPVNKMKVFGVTGKTEVGVPPLRKNTAWKELATIINNKYKGKFKLDAKSVSDRWRNYLGKYKAAREKSNTTGFGVTEEDRKRNIHTIQAKLDYLCPHFERMHALVGDRPNISPAVVFDSGSIHAGTDLNEVLRYNDEEVTLSFNDPQPDAVVGSSGPHEFTRSPNDGGIDVEHVVGSNEDNDPYPLSPQKEATAGPDTEDEVAATSGKRVAQVDIDDGKKLKRDRRKELPSISGRKTPSHARNQLAQAIQDCSSAKAAALLTIEEKRLKFEQMKWETEREEREVRRREEQELVERRRREEQELVERRRKEDKEDERVRRAEENAEKCRERRFALLQTLIVDGKSPDEIKEILALLL